jgi:hypothetical protein
MRKALLSLVVCMLLFQGSHHEVFSQAKDSVILYNPSDSIHKGRLTAVLVTQGVLYAGSLSALYFAWYKDYPQSSFHFFNDFDEWMQMDKVGHMTTSYYISRVGYASYIWAGVDRKKAAWYGGLLGFAYLANIEILDGFSSQWGFSAGDFASNTLGCALFIVQQLAWNEQRFVLKYSFHSTKYPQYRPDLLGTGFAQQLVKDYNGQSYWLSGNISSFLSKSSKFPKWINIAFGYGAEGMTGASGNSLVYHGKPIAQSDRYRQFYLSLDIDLTRIPTRSKTVKTLLTLVSFIKIPFPALEYNTAGKFIVHPFYF